jgi:hypothetical protein
MHGTRTLLLIALPENSNPSAPAFNLETPADYNPEDYRWVPVRRRPRYDGWTEEKQRRFIEVLADTGIVTFAAKAVGMSRESVNRLRHSPDGVAFARAWDAARQYAGSVLEDIAFERAIEGVEQNVYDEYGNIVCTKRVYNDRLLQYLLNHLKPERYGRAAAAKAEPPATPPEAALNASLRAMEPILPAPPEQLLGDVTLADELEIAEIADGALPRFLSEQRAEKTDEQLWAAQLEHGKAACEKQDCGEDPLTDQDYKDMCLYLDPLQRDERGKKRFRRDFSVTFHAIMRISACQLACHADNVVQRIAVAIEIEQRAKSAQSAAASRGGLLTAAERATEHIAENAAKAAATAVLASTENVAQDSA